MLRFVVYFAPLAALVVACVHATGRVPDGPPPEYEEYISPAAASALTHADASPPPVASRSLSPVH